jgi:hypothetical protein
MDGGAPPSEENYELQPVEDRLASKASRSTLLSALALLLLTAAHRARVHSYGKRAYQAMKLS